MPPQKKKKYNKSFFFFLFFFFIFFFFIFFFLFYYYFIFFFLIRDSQNFQRKKMLKKLWIKFYRQQQQNLNGMSLDRLEECKDWVNLTALPRSTPVGSLFKTFCDADNNGSSTCSLSEIGGGVRLAGMLSTSPAGSTMVRSGYASFMLRETHNPPLVNLFDAFLVK